MVAVGTAGQAVAFGRRRRQRRQRGRGVRRFNKVEETRGEKGKRGQKGAKGAEGLGGEGGETRDGCQLQMEEKPSIEDCVRGRREHGLTQYQLTIVRGCRIAKKEAGERTSRKGLRNVDATARACAPFRTGANISWKGNRR
jgi:hypothetical protein